MNELTLKNVYEFINTEDAAKISIDLVQPIHNSKCEAERKLNISVSGDVSKETEHFLQLLEKNSWFAMSAFNVASKLKAQNIISLEPLGDRFYVVTDDTKNRGVCSQEGRILWSWTEDKNREYYEILPLEVLDGLNNSVIRRIVTSWFELYDAGYDAGYENAQ